MKHSTCQPELTRLDLMVLKDAAELLRCDRPDWYDLNELARRSGVPRALILERFPFPELISIAIVVQVWRQWDSNLASGSHRHEGIQAPGLQLLASGWQPDPELLKCFENHPVVQTYRQEMKCSCLCFYPGQES